STWLGRFQGFEVGAHGATFLTALGQSRLVGVSHRARLANPSLRHIGGRHRVSLYRKLRPAMRHWVWFSRGNGGPSDRTDRRLHPITLSDDPSNGAGRSAAPAPLLTPPISPNRHFPFLPDGGTAVERLPPGWLPRSFCHVAPSDGGLLTVHRGTMSTRLR